MYYRVTAFILYTRDLSMNISLGRYAKKTIFFFQKYNMKRECTGKLQKTVSSLLSAFKISKPSGFHAGTNRRFFYMQRDTHPIITAKLHLSPAHGCCDFIYRHRANR